MPSRLFDYFRLLKTRRLKSRLHKSVGDAKLSTSIFYIQAVIYIYLPEKYLEESLTHLSFSFFCLLRGYQPACMRTVMLCFRYNHNTVHSCVSVMIEFTTKYSVVVNEVIFNI